MNKKSEDSRGLTVAIGIIILCIFLLLIILTFYWNSEPGLLNVYENAAQKADAHNETLVTGYVTTSTLVDVAATLLEKPGGYLSNDVMVPSAFMDDMPSWEFGVLIQVRDFTKAMRNEISRAQTQSQEHPDLAKAEPQFNVDSRSWMFPRAEAEYREGIDALERYQHQLTDPNNTITQFYGRADNLSDWLKIVANRLGSLSQRLSASVGQERINTDLAGEPDATQSTYQSKVQVIKTPWLNIDDVVYEARGTCWAIINLLRAIEVDFKPVLEKKMPHVVCSKLSVSLKARSAGYGVRWF